MLESGQMRIKLLPLFLLAVTAVQPLHSACRIPPGRHTDWLFWPFSYIPRKWTAICSDRQPKVVAQCDLNGHNPDVPPPGAKAFSFSKRYGVNFAITSKHRLHFRIGTFRYDYVDHFYEFPSIALKRLK